MKKLISLVLVLAMCISMVPAAIAVENEPVATGDETLQTGVYFELENDVPTGTCITGETNQVGIPIYEGLVFTPGETFTFYYYDQSSTQNASLVLTDNNGNRDAKEIGGFDNVSVTTLGSDARFWAISLTPTNSAEFSLDFLFNIGNSSHNVLFCFFPSAPTPAYTAGIYLDAENGTPKGEPIVGGGSDPWAYRNVPYNSSETTVLYYYDSNLSALGLNSKPDGLTVSVDPVVFNDSNVEHFWKITVQAPNSGFGEFQLNLNAGAQSSFPVFFVDTYTPPAPAYTAGIYPDAKNGAPKGTAITGYRAEQNGPWGYHNISYDSSKTTVLYYYDASAPFLALTGKPDGLTVSVDPVVFNDSNVEHFWKITIQAPNAGFGSFELSLSPAADNNFPIFFVDSYTPTYTKGLYYKPLLGVNDNDPHLDVNASYSNAPLVMTPYFDRFDLAFFFYDGTDFKPVEVIFSDALSVDVVCVDQRPGWYIFAAYDFCSGEIFYDDDSTQTTYSLDISTRIPDFAFYADSTASEENFRMYTIAEENTAIEAPFSNYKFSKTLTFLPGDSNFYFGLGPDSDVALDIYCRQRQYLPNGNETDDISYSDFTCSWEAGGGPNGDYITLTLYTNDSDVLCFLNGYLLDTNGDPCEWLFGAYVNVLAPDDNASLLFHANDQGSYASAKFLPQHLFDELAALGRDVTIGSDAFPGDVTLDKDVVGSIAGETKPVSFCMTAEAATEAEEAIIAAALQSGETSLDVLDLKLYFGSESKHELGGKATIKYTADLAKGTSVRVYYLNDSGELEQMEAKYQNGNIIFTTNHFSKFLLVTAPAVEIPEDIVDEIVNANTGATQETIQAIQNVITEIQTNTALAEESYKPIENHDDVDELKVTLTDMDLANNVPTTIVFQVEPLDEHGDKVSTPSAPITFRLPIPAAMPATYVTVYHNGNAMGTYAVLGSDSNKYIEVESANFSEFAVEVAYTARITVPDGATIVVKDYSGNVISAQQDGSYAVTNGATYSVDVSKDSYISKTVNFTVEDADVTLTVTLETSNNGNASPGIPAPSTPIITAYRINSNVIGKGSVTSLTRSRAGAVITVTATPSENCTVRSVTVTTVTDRKIDVTDNGDGTYSFVMPNRGVTVEVTFGMPFTDIEADHQFYEAIEWVYNQELMIGKTETSFDRVSAVSRQQVWRVLARIINREDPGSMAAAKDWAMAQSISDGTRPGEAATREEFITMMWIAFGKPAADTAVLAKYKDADEISDSAKTAFAWATEVGITEGYADGTMRPAATATRGAFAAILYRYLAK